MEPIVVAAIAAIAGIVSGLVTAFVKPWSENWRDTQGERRARRASDLDSARTTIGIFKGQSEWAQQIRMQAASIGDEQLIALAGRLITAPTDRDREDARGDAMNRIGELRNRL